MILLKNKALIGGVLLTLLTGCSNGLTPYAKSLGIKDVEEIDGVLNNYYLAITMFVKRGVLTSNEGAAEYELERYHLTVEHKSSAFRSGYLQSLYREYPEAQHRRRLCRSVDFDSEGHPNDLECKGVKLSSLAGRQEDMPKPPVVHENQSNALPPAPPAAHSSSQYRVFTPDGKMRICDMNPTSKSVFCY